MRWAERILSFARHVSVIASLTFPLSPGHHSSALSFACHLCRCKLSAPRSSIIIRLHHHHRRHLPLFLLLLHFVLGSAHERTCRPRPSQQNMDSSSASTSITTWLFPVLQVLIRRGVRFFSAHRAWARAITDACHLWTKTKEEEEEEEEEEEGKSRPQEIEWESVQTCVVSVCKDAARL